jgi:hypothetical protein
MIKNVKQNNCLEIFVGELEGKRPTGRPVPS